MSDVPMSSPAELDVDPFTDEALNEPYPVHAEIRNAGPVVYLRKYGIYAMGRHRNVRSSIADWENFSSTGGNGLSDIRKPDAWRPGSPLMEVDPPRHTRVRSALQRILSPQVIRSWREQFEQEAERVVVEVIERQTFDGVVDFAERYVAKTFPDALGLRDSAERGPNLFLIGELNFDSQGPRNSRYEETQRRANEIMPWHDAMMRRENLEPGGFGIKLYEAADAGHIEPEIAPLLVRSFLRGGLDTTASTISSTLWYLAQRPEQFDLLSAEPDRSRAALEETMRLETPIQFACRQTTRSLEIEGTLLPDDSKVMMLMASANRDPSHWERPDEYDMTRSTLGHVALGNGVHMCIGQMIARLEGESLLRALVKRVRFITLAGPVQRKLNNNLRSLRSLPLSVTLR